MANIEAGRGSSHCRDGLSGEAEPPVRMLLAQEFEIVRREIDHDQHAAGADRARAASRIADLIVPEKGQRLMDDDDIERAGRHRQIVDVALPYAAMARVQQAIKRAKQQQHVERQVDAEVRTFEIRPEHFQQDAASAGAGDRAASGTACPASASRIAPSTPASSVTCEALRMRIPESRGVRAEIILRRLRPRRAHRSEPLAVAVDHRVFGIEPRDQRARELGRGVWLRRGGRTPRGSSGEGLELRRPRPGA